MVKSRVENLLSEIQEYVDNIEKHHQELEYIIEYLKDTVKALREVLEGQ